MLAARMDRQEYAFLDLIQLGELPAGYNILQDLRELKASFTTLKNHVTTMSGLVDSLEEDLSVTKKAVSPCTSNECPTFLLAFTIAASVVASSSSSDRGKPSDQISAMQSKNGLKHGK
ncbi:hypothetical protein ACH5RR_021291 [Cinchona calisaya]|uniref:Uncharacterized protein n=1 Tax=Cinchona calisaya TaxID=153742 RepID=A0ABD2ZKP7_9GENT